MKTKKKNAIKCIIAAIAASQTKPRERKEWVKPWLQRRKDLGVCQTLLRELHREDSESFKNYLRCDPATFQRLLSVVKDKITRTNTHMRMSISAEEKLTVTLRYLATGESFTSLSYSFRISPSSISSIIPEVCEHIYTELKDIHLKVPNTEGEWCQISREFEEKWNFPNCIGALDGKHVVMQAPMKSGPLYYNYKNTHSIVLLALVDANCRFVYVDVGANGRASDGGIFRESSLQRAFEKGQMNIPDSSPLPGESKDIPYVIVADEAFPLKEYLMKPFPAKVLNNERRIFNYRLSRARRVVENAFGILCNRFRVFRSPIPLAPEKEEKIVLCACVLHNFLSRNSSFGVNEYSDNLSLTCGTGLEAVTNDGKQGNHSSSKAREIREEFTKFFSGVGQVPWQWQLTVSEP